MQIDKYKLGDIDNAQFYMIPKSLIDSKKYQDLSIPAKVVTDYCLTGCT